jgi:phosphatidate cytidylyltransferase
VSNFWQRAITGTVFVVVMVGCMMWNYWSLCALFFLISMLGLNELYTILSKHGNLHPQKGMGMAVGAILFLLFAFRFQFTSELIFTMMIPLLVAIFFVELYRKQESPFVNIGVTILGIIYVVLPFALWVNFVCPYTTFHNPLIDQFANTFLPTVMYNPHILLGYFFILWTNDTGAYITGRTIGKHKLWERISPKKTLEGFVGGIILSIAVGYLISHYYTELSPILWMTIGLLVGVFGTLGDLVESMFKRSIDVKESGGILPGHGGILDRFDGVLLSTPIILAVIQITEIVSAMLA